jgi:OFA family oxalate/formate antiporter-like MFS transporter
VSSDPVTTLGARGAASMTTQRLVLAGVAANAGVGSLFAWSLIAEEAADDVGLSSAGAAAVFALAVVAMASTVLVTGRVLGRLGPRRVLLCAAAAAGGGLLLAASWRHPPGLFLGVAGLFGAANGMAYSVAATLASWVPAGRRGAATGAVVAAYAGAPVLLGVVGPPLIDEHGWRTCTLVNGGVASGLVLLAALLAPAAAPHADHADAARPGGRAPSGTLLWLWVLFAGGAAPALMVFAHAVALADLRGLDAGAAGLTVSALAGGNLAGRIGAGWLSDVVGRLPTLALVVAAQAVAVGAITWGGGAGLAGGCAVLGFCYGAISALVPAATADRVGVRAFPRSFARVFSAWGVAGLTAPVLGAGLVDLAATTPSALALAALPLLPAGLAWWVLARPTGRPGSGRADARGEVGRGQDQL